MFRIAVEYFDFVVYFGVYFGYDEYSCFFFSGEDIEDYIDVGQMQNVGI